ncbi:uncharacterized protein TNCV_3573341 [Trichonephila clavipes]|nr:uncharacterized protein TNCV_3573341 [Trichonephila clavipes]
MVGKKEGKILGPTVFFLEIGTERNEIVLSPAWFLKASVKWLTLSVPPCHNELAAVAEWYMYRTVACFVMGSSPVPLKTRHVGQRCTLNLSRAETSSRWCGVVVRRGVPAQGVVT